MLVIYAKIKNNEINNTITFTNTIYKPRCNISHIRLTKLVKGNKI